MVADDHEQGVLVVRRLFRFLEELPQRPVRVAHGGQVLVVGTTVGYRRHRQLLRQRIGSVVGKALQQRVERLARVLLGQLHGGAVEHILVGHPPGRIDEHRVDEVLATDEVAHALVAEEPGLVVPLEIAVVHVQIVVAAGTELLWQAGELVAALGHAHQVLETRQVGEAGHGGKHALVGVGAIGEETGEQQPLLAQPVEVGGDASIAAQCPDPAAGKALHQDHHHVLDRQRALGRRRGVTADRCAVRVDQHIVLAEQHLAHRGQSFGLRQGRFPGIVAMIGKAVFGGINQRQDAIQAQVVGEDRIGGVSVAPAQRRPLLEGAASSDHRQQQAHKEHAETQVPGQRRTHLARPGDVLDPVQQHDHRHGAQGPGQQVARHREAVPEHAGDRAQVFFQVLEYQTVEALVKLAVEVHLGDAEQQAEAGDAAQPQHMNAPRGHRAQAEDRQQQRRHGVHHHTQVEARAIEKGFEQVAGRGLADQLGVVVQQRQAQGREHQHQQQRTGGSKGKVATQVGAQGVH